MNSVGRSVSWLAGLVGAFSGTLAATGTSGPRRIDRQCGLGQWCNGLHQTGRGRTGLGTIETKEIIW